MQLSPSQNNCTNINIIYALIFDLNKEFRAECILTDIPGSIN